MSTTVPLRTAVLLILAGAFGCVSRPTAPQGRYGLPADGRVRLVATRLKESDNELHWKWSLLGSRNWERAEVAGTEAKLLGGYPLNATDRNGGSHVWEMDLTARRTKSEWSWTLTVHGSNGETARHSGTAQSIRIQGTSDTETGLPADLSLAQIDRSPVRWVIPR